MSVATTPNFDLSPESSDWFDDGNARYMVLLGDCIEMMRTLPAESITAVVCDPDYGIPSNTNTKRGEGQWQGWEVPFSDNFQGYSAKWATEALRVLRPGGWLLAFGGSRTLFRIAAGIGDAGFEIKDTLIWHHNQGQLLGTNLRTEDDEGNCLWSTRLRPTFDPVVMARKPTPLTLLETFEKYGTGLLNIAGCRRTDLGDSKWPNNIQPFSKPARSEIPPGIKHMATKPLALMRWMVRLVCPPGGIVLDPFAGSGTTLEAALLEGCNVVAIERDPSWIEAIIWRADRARNLLSP